MLIEDHFVVTVSRRIQAEGENFGPYHQHHMSIELRHPAVCNRKEAIGRFKEICRHYPEPEFRCSLMQVVCRGVPLADSSAK